MENNYGGRILGIRIELEINPSWVFEGTPPVEAVPEFFAIIFSVFVLISVYSLNYFQGKYNYQLKIEINKMFNLL